MTRIELLHRLSGIVFRGLTAGSSVINNGQLSTLTGEQVSALASSAASGAEAILTVQKTSPEQMPLRAEQCAVIFAALTSGNVGITSQEIASAAATAASCFAAVWSAITPLASPALIGMQVDAAVQAFSGLACGLANITDDQITQIAALATNAAAAIRAAN